MTAMFLPPSLQKILVVAPIYDESEILFNVTEIVDEYDWTIFNGGICYPNDNIDALLKRLDIMQNLIDTKKVVYNISHQDLMFIKQLDYNNPAHSIIENWIFSKPNVIIANFPRRRVIVVDGGIPPSVKKLDDLLDNLEVSFTTYVGDKLWHKLYNGRLGYVVANGPLTLEAPKFYNHSMQLGNYYGPDANIYFQEVGELGLKRTFIL